MKGLSRTYLVFASMVILSGAGSSVFAQSTSTSLTESVDVYGEVIGSTVPPVTPPPSPSPITNNGVPLPQNESGTDTVLFKGFAYPGATVTILRNGLPLNSRPTNSDGTFEVPITNIKPGTYTFGVKAEYSFLSSFITTYTIYIPPNEVITIDDIYLSPTLTSDKLEALRGTTVIFSGKAIPNSDIVLTVYFKNGITKNLKSDSTGAWRFVFDTKEVDEGEFTVKVRSKTGQTLSPFSNPLLFTVGKQNRMRKSTPNLVNARCDLNNDSRVNLIDFSIMAFWYKRLGFPLKVDLNSDGRVNLTDLSILAYCWTG